MKPYETETIQAIETLIATYGDKQRAIMALQSYRAPDVKSHIVQNNTRKVISLREVVKQYGKKSNTQLALNNVNLDIYEGEFIAITGPSGSGKSTLLHMIGGLDKPTSGEVIVGNRSLKKMNDRDLSSFRNKTIGFVFQFFYMQPFLKIIENVQVPAMFKRTNKKAMDEVARNRLSQVGLDKYINRYSKQLSGGQIQRAAIARALVNNPPILLADEPTGNLDSANGRAIIELFQKIRNELGTTIIIITHDLAIAALADRQIRMHDGEVGL